MPRFGRWAVGVEGVEQLLVPVSSRNAATTCNGWYGTRTSSSNGAYYIGPRCVCWWSSSRNTCNDWCNGWEGWLILGHLGKPQSAGREPVCGGFLLPPWYMAANTVGKRRPDMPA